MDDLKESPSQTAGPYVHIGCVPKFAGLEGMYDGQDPGAVMISGPVDAATVQLTCMIFDGDGQPLKDAMVEIWQAGPEGSFGKTEHFSNWGRGATDSETGLVSFETLKPGAVDGQAPHILVWIVARGINIGLTTRIYFADDVAQRDADPVCVLAGDRAGTLVASKKDAGYHHDIFLQGACETVFFDV